MVLKYDPEINPLGSVILYPERKYAIAAAIHTYYGEFKRLVEGQRHWAEWPELYIANSLRGCLIGCLATHLERLDGIRILHPRNCFLILLDGVVVMHIKKDDGSLICSPPPKLFDELQYVLVQGTRLPDVPMFPDWKAYKQVEPSANDVSEEVDILVRDTKVIVGLYEPNIDYQIVNFTIGIQRGKELLHPYSIDLNLPTSSSITPLPPPPPTPPTNQEKSSTTFSRGDSESEGKAIGAND